MNVKTGLVLTLLVKNKIMTRRLWIILASTCKSNKQLAALKFNDIDASNDELQSMECWDCHNFDNTIDDYIFSAAYLHSKQLCSKCIEKIKRCEWCGYYNYCIIKSDFRGSYEFGGSFVSNVCIDWEYCNIRGLRSRGHEIDEQDEFDEFDNM